MTTQYGPTSTGFVVKPYQEIVGEVNAALLGSVNPALDVDPDDPLGQVIGACMEQVSEVWEILPVLYGATNRGDAEGPMLQNIGSLQGIPQLPTTPSTVPARVAFSAAGTYAVGSLVAFLSTIPTVQFSNLAAITAPTLVGGLPISPSNPYVVPAAIFESADDGPASGNALIAANFAAGIAPSPATPGTLLTIVPVTGWLSVGDVAGPTLGTLVESDAAYRGRQVEELSEPGACTPDAIVAHVLAALASAISPPVGASVTVYENTTLATNSDGLPGKSFMTVVFDGTSPNTAQDDPLIAAAIWANKPAGMQPFGSTSFSVNDSQGNPRTVFYSRPTQISVYLSITVAIDANANPSAVGTAVAQAIIDAAQGSPFSFYGQTVTPGPSDTTTLAPGKDVVRSAYSAIAQGQEGVRDVPTFTLGTAPAPAGTANITIGKQQVGVVSLATIVVNVVRFVP